MKIKVYSANGNEWEVDVDTSGEHPEKSDEAHVACDQAALKAAGVWWEETKSLYVSNGDEVSKSVELGAGDNPEPSEERHIEYDQLALEAAGVWWDVVED